MAKEQKPLLTTRNVTLVSYRLDEITSTEDTQAQILTDLLQRFYITPSYESYSEINKALEVGEVTEGTFVLLGKAPEAIVVVAKYRAVAVK